MEDIVRLFNRLSRPKATPTGLPNHWVFGARHVPLSPPGDLVIAVHPPSRFVLQAGPAQILSASSVAERAKALVPLLLNAFIKGSEAPGGRQPTDPSPFAPWTWATEDPQLAKAVEDHLKRCGVKHELCSVGVCSAKEKEVLEERWSSLYRTLLGTLGPAPLPTTPLSAATPGDASRCHGCGLSRDAFSDPLMRCSACGKAYYHSPACQRQHWKQHKPTCLANRPPTTGPASSAASASAATSSNVDAHTYYNSAARVAPDAQALMKTLHLSPPASPTSLEGTAKPLRALVYTGHDTSENMQALFGPNWRRDMTKAHEETRLEILLSPPHGSPSYAMNAATSSDLSSLARSPRPATDAEQQEITKVREIQEAVRQRVGAGKAPSKDDMMAILMGFGPDWPSNLQTYMLAVNTMDQGVRC